MTRSLSWNYYLLAFIIPVITSDLRLWTLVNFTEVQAPDKRSPPAMNLNKNTPARLTRWIRQQIIPISKITNIYTIFGSADSLSVNWGLMRFRAFDVNSELLNQLMLALPRNFLSYGLHISCRTYCVMHIRSLQMYFNYYEMCTYL